MADLLFLDDDPSQCDLWKQLLEHGGHRVETAETVAEAKRILEQTRPQLVITDVRVPEARDGLAFIRSVKQSKVPARIIVLTGWSYDIADAPERNLADRILEKPVQAQELLRAIAELLVLWFVFLLAGGTVAAETFHFQVKQRAEVVATLDMASPGSDWAVTGREAALAALTVDNGAAQHVMLYAGETRYSYAAFLGSLSAGEHQLRVERDSRYSATGSGLRVFHAGFREVPPDDANFAALAHAPILFARADTVGEFSDVPMISYYERLSENGRPFLQYTMIFSNEDGGTSTRALMARWGRTTDVEYIYKAWLNANDEVERATIQAKDHKEIDFQGRREGSHPLLIPSTRNNMVSAEGSSPIRYQIPPVTVDLSSHSREIVMDDNPLTYRVMAQELEREKKLRPFGVVDGENVSDPRNYLYLEAKVSNQQSTLAALIRLEGESIWRSSHLGRVDYAVSRSGWFRTTVELPPGTQPEKNCRDRFRMSRATSESPTDRRGVPSGGRGCSILPGRRLQTRTEFVEPLSRR